MQISAHFNHQFVMKFLLETKWRFDLIPALKFQKDLSSLILLTLETKYVIWYVFGPARTILMANLTGLKLSESKQFWNHPKASSKSHLKLWGSQGQCGSWMIQATDYGCPMKQFFIGIPNFWAWADKLGRGHLGYFRLNYQYFGIVSPLSMFSTIQSLFLQKTKPLYPHFK